MQALGSYFLGIIILFLHCLPKFSENLASPTCPSTNGSCYFPIGYVADYGDGRVEGRRTRGRVGGHWGGGVKGSHMVSGREVFSFGLSYS